ncbi:MAG: hypothetical protein FJZ01_17010 [Candidatus Sericytochromatia bacterium]|nr:hypothetical protein [Candidatus Tanganyikabacteria bacterium]
MRVLHFLLLASLAACGAGRPGAPLADRPETVPPGAADRDTKADYDGFDALKGVLEDENVKAMLDGDWQLATGSVLVTAAVSLIKEGEELPNQRMRPGDFIVGMGAGLEGDRPLYLVFAGVDARTRSPRVIEILKRRNAEAAPPSRSRDLMRAGEAIRRALASDAQLGDALVELKRTGQTTADVPELRWGLRYRARFDQEPPTGVVTMLLAKPRPQEPGGGGGPAQEPRPEPKLDVTEIGHANLDLATRELLPDDPAPGAPTP